MKSSPVHLFSNLSSQFQVAYGQNIYQLHVDQDRQNCGEKNWNVNSETIVLIKNHIFKEKTYLKSTCCFM
jgi:hypothetical protein